MIALIPRRILIAAMAAGLAGAAVATTPAKAAGLTTARGVAGMQPQSGFTAHSFTLPAIDGGIIDLAAFAGRPILIVATASNCSYTPQYAGLEVLHETFGPAGLVVIGIPSDDFGGQEPGDAAQIVSFTSGKYDVSFPLTGKMHFKGAKTDGFLRWLQAEGEPARWNFHKWLIGPDGKVVASFPSGIAPDSPHLIKAIRSSLSSRPTG